MQLFRSTTLKLTAWYLAILMSISVAFSVVIYQLNFREVNARLETLQHNLLEDDVFLGLSSTRQEVPLSEADKLRIAEVRTASRQMIGSLIWVNIIVLVGGGVASFAMARRTLRPVEAAHEAQSRFTSDASHELRTPLAAMKAELEVSLRGAPLKKQEVEEILESNLEEVNKLISITEMLLHLSRLEYDKLEVTSVNLSELTHDAILGYTADQFVITAKKKALTAANEPAIREVIDILIENAVKYSPKDKKITIRIFEQRGHVVFRIKNNGPAISKEAIARLFDRFYRGDQSRTGSGRNGYGLGLSIAKKIIDIHGGYITVSSNARETSFTFYLPIRVVPEEIQENQNV